jgi:hypothetical protein
MTKAELIDEVLKVGGENAPAVEQLEALTKAELEGVVAGFKTPADDGEGEEEKAPEQSEKAKAKKAASKAEPIKPTVAKKAKKPPFEVAEGVYLTCRGGVRGPGESVELKHLHADQKVAEKVLEANIKSKRIIKN